MLDILTFWMKEGADGFRVDAINHMYESASFTNQKMIDESLDPNLYSSYETTYTKDLVLNSLITVTSELLILFLFTE